MNEVRDIGAYGISEAAHYLSLPPATLRSWVRGYRYKVVDERRFSEPLIQLPDPAEPLLSFTNVVEAHVLAAIRRDHQVSMQRVRPALDFLERKLGVTHPLAHKELLTDGVNLFAEHLGDLVNLSEDGQLGVREYLRAHLQRVAHDREGLAEKLFPFSRGSESLEQPRVVVLDPRISFGRPSIAGTSIRTDVIASRLKAGESIEELAADYDIESDQIQEAIRYELAA
jgi:uncharacterized protein (DUF433 family)